MKKTRKILRNLIFVIIAIYMIFVLINQQKTLNRYSKNAEELQQQIATEEANKEELLQKQEAVNSLEFIEEMAREKLDMYYPYERIYVDKGM